jgi:hypothetical protein
MSLRLFMINFFIIMMPLLLLMMMTIPTTTAAAAHQQQAMIISKLFPDLAEKMQPQLDEEERKLLSSSMGTCNTDREVSRGPNALITSLTDPSIYDKTKRPSISYHPSRDISTNPDYVFTRLVINSIVSLNELTQSLTTRLD